MTKEEAIQELLCLCDEMPSMECRDWKIALDMAIKALKTVDEIIEYMNDKTVTWRDISDDIINGILSKHNWKE